MPTGQRRDRAKSFLLVLRILKQTNPCMDCQKKYPHYVMEWDHREPGERLANATAWHTGKFLSELQKVDLLCANCHKARTWARRTFRQGLLGE
jgi:hypothetical protein